MVLYEDLRAHTVWKVEMSQINSSQERIFRRTALEWEAIGDLCNRLHHKVIIK